MKNQRLNKTGSNPSVRTRKTQRGLLVLVSLPGTGQGPLSPHLCLRPAASQASGFARGQEHTQRTFGQMFVIDACSATGRVQAPMPSFPLIVPPPPLVSRILGKSSCFRRA